ncbi:MAG: glycosyltransferase, partial [Candidatus Omnitrophica bacterium]|nr:glycosyltransferase [Candidatus Omnitrophota bacterium]
MRSVGIDAHAIGMRKGGNETYALALLKGLTEIGSADFRFVVFLSEKVTVPDFLVNNPLFRTVFVSPRAGARIFQLSRKVNTEKIQLLHTQYHVPPFCPCSCVITFHDVSFLRYPQFFPRGLCWRLKISMRYAVGKAKKIITVSEFSRKEILSLYKIPAEKVVTIYNGYSDIFRPIAQEKRASLAKFGITKPYILSVSNLQPRKNLSRLIQAF